MSECHLIRHGEVDNPQGVVYADLPGFGLSERGRRQAAAAASHLADRPLAAVFSSPLRRAVQTASAIAGASRLPVHILPELGEWGLLSLWRGLRWEELEEARPGQLRAYLEHPLRLDFSPESLTGLADRMTRTITALAAGSPPGAETAVVSHQDPLAAARLSLLGLPLDRFREGKPEHAEIISLLPPDEEGRRAGEPWRETARVPPTSASLENTCARSPD